MEQATEGEMMHRARGRHGLAYAMVAACTLGVLIACSPADDGEQEAVFRIQACDDQTFQVLVREPRVIQEAERLIGAEQQRIVSGQLTRGDGGFNQPWSWHLVPETVEFADATIELCDGCPRMVEQELDYWVETVGQFCPWTTRVLERVR